MDKGQGGGRRGQLRACDRRLAMQTTTQSHSANAGPVSDVACILMLKAAKAEPPRADVRQERAFAVASPLF